MKPEVKLLVAILALVVTACSVGVVAYLEANDVAPSPASRHP